MTQNLILSELETKFFNTCLLEAIFLEFNDEATREKTAKLVDAFVSFFGDRSFCHDDELYKAWLSEVVCDKVINTAEIIEKNELVVMVCFLMKNEKTHEHKLVSVKCHLKKVEEKNKFGWVLEQRISDL